MGVEDVSELQSNYVSPELDSEEEEEIIRMNACTIREEDKRTSESTKSSSNIPRSNSSTSNMIYSSLAPNC